jgi:hypothetical protein
MSAALLFTISRSGYLAMFASVMIWGVAGAAWFFYVRNGKRLTPARAGVLVGGAAALIVALAAIAPLSVRGLENAGVNLGRYGDRIEATTDFDTSEIATRRALWSLAWDMTLDRPLLGYGQDGFSIKFPAYRDRPDLPGIRTESVDPESAHNALLDISSGTGFLGLFSFLFLTGVVFTFGGKKLLSENGPSTNIAMLALIAACAGYLVAVTLGFMEAITTWAFWLLLGAMAGLSARVPQREHRHAEPSPSIMSKVIPLGLGAIGVVAILWAAAFTAANLSSGQARAALEEGNVEAALRLSRRAVTLDPLERVYVLQRGEAYEQNVAQLGNEEAYRRAMDSYRTALVRFAPESTAALSAALMRRQLNQAQGLPLDDAWADLEYAVSLDPFNSCLRRFVADIYQQDDQYERALKHTVMIRYFSYTSVLPRCARLAV